MKPNVIEKVVQNNICIGCGVCSGVCPANVLRMEFNKYGEYNPVESPGCLKNCKLCLEVCPFYDQNENEDDLASDNFSGIEGIKHLKETGYYLDSYVGYSNANDHRGNGASGGIATWILETLLAHNIVDYVVCVTPDDDPEKLFRFAVFKDIVSIRQAAKSAYYPVELSAVINEIFKNPGRYAVTGLPCFLKSLTLAAKKNKKLRERIIITIGLVCGQMKNKNYTMYLSSLAGLEGNLKKANYRGKSPQKPANNFFFQCVNENENGSSRIFWDEGVSNVWNNRWFTPNACNFCDDVFAETANISVMDAWLPMYSKDSRGTSLLIVRTPLINALLKQAVIEQEISLEKISIKDVIRSQSEVLKAKRMQLAFRLYLTKKKKRYVPKKRVVPSAKIDFFNKKEVELKDKMQSISNTLFFKYCNNGKINTNRYAQDMNTYVYKLKFYRRIFAYKLKFYNPIFRYLFLPTRVIRKIRKVIGVSN